MLINSKCLNYPQTVLWAFFSSVVRCSLSREPHKNGLFAVDLHYWNPTGWMHYKIALRKHPGHQPVQWGGDRDRTLLFFFFAQLLKGPDSTTNCPLRILHQTPAVWSLTSSYVWSEQWSNDPHFELYVCFYRWACPSWWLTTNYLRGNELMTPAVTKVTRFLNLLDPMSLYQYSYTNNIKNSGVSQRHPV